MNDLILLCVEYQLEQSGTKKHMHSLNFVTMEGVWTEGLLPFVFLF